MRDRLQTAIELRSTGRAEEARAILLDLVAACPDDAELPLVPLWSAEPLACAKLNEAVSASANAIVNSFFTLFLSSEVIRDKTE